MHKHGTKTTPVFLPADGEASWLLLPSLVSLLSGGTVQPENTYSCILKVTDQVWECQKRISINTNHSYHQRSSFYASLNWSNNKNRWKHLPHKAFYHDTITRRVANQGYRGTFFPWGKAVPAGHQPSISMSQSLHQTILTFSESYWQTILHTFPEFISKNTDIFREFLPN